MGTPVVTIRIISTVCVNDTLCNELAVGRLSRCFSVNEQGVLLEHGADPNAVWHGHSPYATARIYGNDTVADTLNHLGHSTHLSPLEPVLAMGAQGTAPSERLEPGDINDEDRNRA